MKKPNIQHIAAKGIVTSMKGEVLILQQSDPTISGHNRYHPPGGMLEMGESLQECLVREIKEETGLDAQVGELLNVGEWQSERGDTVMQFVGVFYHCTVSEGTAIELQSEEVGRADWVSLENIDNFDIAEPSLSVIKQFLQNRTT